MNQSPVGQEFLLRLGLSVRPPQTMSPLAGEAPQQIDAVTVKRGLLERIEALSDVDCVK